MPFRARVRIEGRRRSGGRWRGRWYCWGRWNSCSCAVLLPCGFWVWGGGGIEAGGGGGSR